MAIIKNEDLDIMIQVEELLHTKLTCNDEVDDDEYDIWCKYWNLVERLIVNKKTAIKRSNNWNKHNIEYHRFSNNLYNARKRKDKKRIEYYTKKLEELKK